MASGLYLIDLSMKLSTTTWPSVYSYWMSNFSGSVSFMKAFEISPVFTFAVLAIPLKRSIRWEIFYGFGVLLGAAAGTYFLMMVSFLKVASMTRLLVGVVDLMAKWVAFPEVGWPMVTRPD